MPALPVDRLGLAALATCLLGLGAWTVAQESAPYMATGTRVERLAQLPGHPPFPGLSLGTRQDGLMDCAYALRRRGSLEVLFQSEAFRDGLPARCRAMALEAAGRMPTYSYAWYVAAYADAALQDWDSMNEHLRMSHATGPSSQWVAELRVALSEDERNHLTEDALRANEDDLRLLLASERGVRSIAARYVNDVSFRERITTLAETMPEDVQRRLVGVLRYLTR